MTSTWSRSWTISSSTADGVAGLMATAARLPSVLIFCTVRCRLLLPSQWTRNESEPAATNSSRKESGSEIIRWISRGSRVTRRRDWTITAPMDRFGTKCPSITSTWIRSAPPCSASTTWRPRRQPGERLEDGRFEQLFGLGFLQAVNIHFRLDDRHEARGDDLPGDLELLGHDVLDPRSVGLLDERAHLGSKDALRVGFVEQRGKLGHRLHQLDTALLRGQALVHLQKRHDPLHVPQIVRGRLPLDIPVDRVLEQDGADDALAGEAGARHDARAHLVHDLEHLCLAGPRVLLDSVGTQRAGRAAPALIQRRNEPGMGLHLLQLLVVGHLGHLVLLLFR